MSTWTRAQAEEHLLGLELFGMRFGLDRMRRLTTVLGSPERSFASIHVVGTNGKSSTVRMTEELLARHGRRAGSYTSPHLVSFTERIHAGGRDVEQGLFAAAVQRAARAAEAVQRTLPPGDGVTQFELLTAAAYLALAESGVEVAVVEAGLGGRWDATNTIPSRVQALTNVGLDHTRWLGPTVRDIAREKLAVVRDGATLVVGPLHPDAEEEAVATAARHDARLIQAPESLPDVAVSAPGAFQRQNFALAATAAEAFLGELDASHVRAAAASVSVAGRCEVIARDPLTIVDGAHNPPGVRALIESLPELLGDRELVAVVSVLEDKDAAGMLRELLPSSRAVVFTRNANPRALPPATLESLARQVAGDPPSIELEADPHAALRRARELAGRDGAVLATGSIYLVADLARGPGARRASTL
ncbi:MAG: bifunctional folylpolyglutamate synthase/dihydrofolate synthase [Actinomycetota bacterium]|nr:bifunctional folylpolyglutamate synthase/dihydrofolate synthase [Actinomycetota bacterium]